MNIILYQLSQLAAALFMGMLLAFYYDLYRLAVLFFAVKKPLLGFFDLLWWLSATLFFCFFWYGLLAGEMRLTLFLWQVLGFAFFRAYFSPLLRKGEKSAPFVRRRRPLPPRPPAPPSRVRRILGLPALALAKIFDLTGKAFWLAWGGVGVKKRQLAGRLSCWRKKPPPGDNDGN